MKFTVWGRELQWRTSGRESISFPTVSIERSKNKERKKDKKQNKRETCSQNMMTVIQTLSPFFSASSNSLLHLFFRKRATINNLSKKSTRPKVGILTHDSAIRWIGCAVSLLLLLGQEKCTRERELKESRNRKVSSITVDKRWWWWWMWSFTLRGCLRSE